MDRPWEAEEVVEPARARALIEAQFPDLAPAEVTPFGVGWDNTAYLVNGTWVFRFPRRTIAVPWIETETRVLSAIHERLPAPVPVPVHVGRPSAEFGWPFAGYRLLPGTTACCAELEAPSRAALAEPLGRFLAALHGIPAEEAAAIGAGPDEIRRTDVPYRSARAREALSDVRERGLISDITPLLDVVAAAAETRPPRRLALVHGDLYARHVLVDDARTFCGVIDWGDTHVGEPATDLAIAFMLLEPDQRTAFRDAYGPIEDDVWLRARFRAVYHQANTALYANAIGERTLLGACLFALECVARD